MTLVGRGSRLAEKARREAELELEAAGRKLEALEVNIFITIILLIVSILILITIFILSIILLIFNHKISLFVLIIPYRSNFAVCKVNYDFQSSKQRILNLWPPQAKLGH